MVSDIRPAIIPLIVCNGRKEGERETSPWMLTDDVDKLMNWWTCSFLTTVRCAMVWLVSSDFRDIEEEEGDAMNKTMEVLSEKAINALELI